MGRAIDRNAIAARIRALIAGQDGDDPGATARRLGVDEVAFRMSVDELSPYPTVDVIAALVASYGVDPCWLLSGEYDPGAHRSALEERQSLDVTIARLMEPLPPMRPSAGHLKSSHPD